jgi:hypothetical protein
MNSVNKPSFSAKILSLMLFCVCANHAFAALFPNFNLEKQIEDADLIVVAKPCDDKGTMTVVAVYQGNAAKAGDTISVKVELKDDYPAAIIYEAFESRSPVCVFLKKSENQTFVPSGVIYTSFRVGDTRPEASPTVAHAIETELLLGLKSTDRLVVNDAVEWLTLMKSEEGQRAILELAKKKDVPASVRAYALMQEIPGGKKAVLERAVAFVKEAETNKEMRVFRNRVAYAFADIKATDDVDFLNKLLLEADVPISRALSFSAYDYDWANQTAIPYLIKALDRLDAIGQRNCASALVKLTGRKIPFDRDFVKNAAKHVAEWQTWWKQEGEKKYGTPRDKDK